MDGYHAPPLHSFRGAMQGDSRSAYTRVMMVTEEEAGLDGFVRTVWILAAIFYIDDGVLE